MTIDNDKALDQFRGPGICEICREKCFRREPFHILAAALSGGGRVDHPYNALGVCGAMSGGDECHRRWHDGNLLINGHPAKVSDFFGIVGRRENKGPIDLERAVTWFRNLSPKVTETAIERALRIMRPARAAMCKELLAARERSLLHTERLAIDEPEVIVGDGSF